MNKNNIGFKIALSSISLNLLSLYLFYRFDFLKNTIQATITNLSWFISVIIFIISISILYPDKIKNTEAKTLNLQEKILFITLLIFALSIRLYKIKFNGLYLDEWYWLANGREILSGIIRSPFGSIGHQLSNMPAYLIAILFAIFRDGYLAVRLPGVIYSLFNLYFIFLFIKEAFDKKTAFISSLLISTSIWDIHMSQLGWNNINLNPFLISGLILFTYRGFKNLSEKDMLITGIFLGMCLNLLYITSVYIIVIFAYIIYQLILTIQPVLFKNVIISRGLSVLNPEEKKEKIKKIITLTIILIITTFIIFSPTLIKIIKYPDVSKDFINNNINYSKENGNLYYYLENVKLTIQDFSYKSDNYKKVVFWRITIEPVVYYLFIVGFIYSLCYIHLPHNFIIILSFLIIFIQIIMFYSSSGIYIEHGLLPVIYILASAGVYIISRIPFEPEISIGKYKLKTNFINNFYIFIIIIYFAGWLSYFSNYRANLLINEPDYYESFCKRITEYIKNDISENTLIVLPDEMGKALISINLMDKYKYDTYYNYFSLIEHLIQRKPLAIVEIIPSGYSFSFYMEQLKMQKSLLAFEEIMQISNPYFEKIYIRTLDNGKICGLIYYLTFKNNTASGKLTHYKIPSFKYFNQDKRINLCEPKDLEIDNNDNVYISDSKNCKIIKLDSSGNFIMSLGLKGNKPGQVQEQCGLEIDCKTGDIWVADTGNHRVEKFNSKGKLLKIIDGSFYSPNDIAIDKYGNIYVCDTGNGVIKKYNSRYEFVKEWGCKTLFSNYMLPYYIKVDEEGYIYVSDIAMLRIIVFSSEGKYLKEFSLKPFLKYYSSEIYLFIEGNNILVSDTVNNKIMRFNKNGQLLNSITVNTPGGIIKNSRDEIIYGDTTKKILNVIYF
jgi:hypothetical protein